MLGQSLLSGIQMSLLESFLGSLNTLSAPAEGGGSDIHLDLLPSFLGALFSQMTGLLATHFQGS